MLRTFSILLLLGISVTPFRVALAFDLMEAIYTETILRSAAIACTDKEFARKFISQSKAQVAFDLQGDGDINAHEVEEIISKANERLDRKSTRLNSSHVAISYAVFCLKKKNIKRI